MDDTTSVLLRSAADILERYFGDDHRVSARDVRIAATCAERGES